jgi:hypothetical protein
LSFSCHLRSQKSLHTPVTYNNYIAFYLKNNSHFWHRTTFTQSRPVIHLDGKKAQNYPQDYVIPSSKKRQVRKKQPKHYLNLTGFSAFSGLMIDGLVFPF